MNSYVRDDGVEMVETSPGCFSRRDSLGLLGLTPLARRSPVHAAPTAVEPPPLAPSHDDLAPEPAAPPPLQPSHDDLAARMLEQAPVEAEAVQVAAVVPPRAPCPRPPKRSIAAILAEADRNHRRKGRA